MRKALALGTTILVVVSALLVACGGTPKPPVSNLINLDKLVTDNMTIDQVDALMTTKLKATSMLYQAQSVVQTTDGNWEVASKDGGFAPGETGAYQVILFAPAKGEDKYYAIFFKANVVMGKSWFDARGGVIIEKLLTGQPVVVTLTPTTTATTK